MAKSASQLQAEKFVDFATSEGFAIDDSHPSVLRISKRFTPGDSLAFANADMMAFSVLDYAPLRGGSTWGTDGGSIGGYSGLMRGQYVLNKSGSNASFRRALRATLARHSR